VSDLSGVYLLAESSDHRERSDAARSLAQHADDPAAHPFLLRLLLDAKDTGVTAAAAEALVGRADEQGLRLLALAYAQTTPAVEDTAEEMVAVLFRETTDVDAVQSRLPPHRKRRGRRGQRSSQAIF
jgi:hypothetical protein